MIYSSENGKGRTTALNQSTQKILKILDPTMLPITISDFFLYAATTDVAISGKDVPIAIIVKPIKD